MNPPTGFRLPRSLLPRPGIDLKKWAVVACDQYTAEPDYWRAVEAEVGDAPSALKLIFPEVHLGAADAPARIAHIQQAMRQYLADGLLREHDGAILVERTVHGRTRRGLMLELDLEHYDFSAGSTSLIRPTEGTIVARLAPRIEVRRGAELELPHILVLIDDPQQTVIEPIAAARAALAPLYDTELMQGGGHVAGFAVSAAAAVRAVQALGALADPPAFATRYGVPAGTPPMLFAVGDGNHSLATAKSIWDAARATVGPDHPSRWALVEVENIHDSALHFAPIHRLLFGVTADVRRALAEAFGARVSCTDVASAAAMRERLDAMSATSAVNAAGAAGAVGAINAISATGGARHVAGLIGPGARFSVVELADPPAGLAVGTFQAFIDSLIDRGGACDVDYVHGDDVLERLAVAEGCIGLHLAGVGKSELLKRVVHDGPLPRKTFSMGEAHEKRFYVEARRIR